VIATTALLPVVAQAQPEQDFAHELESVSSSGVGAERNFAKFPKIEPQQLTPKGKLDLNSATVNEYTQFKGLYPTVAGKIASNGPYGSVKDVYSVLDMKEASRFRKYESNFVALPPGRMFNERINQRQST